MSELSTHTRSREDPQDGAGAPERAGVATVISIVGAVCGTLPSLAFEGTSDALRLVGAVLGAAVGALFSVQGRYLHLRASAGVLVTGVALLVTYGGGRVATELTGKDIYPKLAFEEPRPTPTPTSEPTPTPTPTVHPDETCEAGLCMTVTTPAPLCSEPGCDYPVTILNSGTRTLRIKDVGIEGAAAEAFRQAGDCADHTFAPGDSCRVVVTSVAVPSGRAELVIHQNFRGPASRVALSSPVGPTRPDLTLSAQVSCSISPDEPETGVDLLAIRTTLRTSGPGDIDRPVLLRLENAGDTIDEITVPAGTGTAVRMTAILTPADYAGAHRFTITADPGGEIDETDEANNSIRVTATPAERPASETEVPCEAA